MKSPYSELPARNYWRSGVTESHPLTVEGLYFKKFEIAPTDKVATAGSCFAQHVSNFMRKSGYAVMDVEPPPPGLPADVAKSFGYEIYSARYGNIYTVRQLLQLARDAESGHVDAANVWEKDGRFFDALRPNVEPNGFRSVEEVLALRRDHLAKVKMLFAEMNILVFTFGLTETWIDRRSGRVFPTAPGTIAGEFDPEVFAFKNFGFNEVYDDFVAFHELVRKRNPGIRFILTVSPVPLTATAMDKHVLVATTQHKSVLRAVAGALADAHENIDYFPSYELIASPFSKAFFYDANLRTVNPGGVASVMRIFFDQHRPLGAAANEAGENGGEKSRRERRLLRRQRKDKEHTAKPGSSKEEVVCEEVLLEAFAP